MNISCSSHELACQPSKVEARQWQCVTMVRMKSETHSRRVNVTHSSLATSLELVFSKSLKREEPLWWLVNNKRSIILENTKNKFANQACIWKYSPRTQDGIPISSNWSELRSTRTKGLWEAISKRTEWRIVL